MRLNRYLLAASASLIAFAACQKEYEPYEKGPEDSEGTKTEVYFIDAPSAVELTTEDKTYTVTLGRDVTTGALTVPVEVVFNQYDAFTVPESVTFNDGEATAALEINIEAVEAAKASIIEVRIPSDYYYLYKEYTTANVSHSFKAAITKITWETIDTGVYSSCYLGDREDVNLQACKEVPGRYRFVDPFGAGTNIEFITTGKEQDNTDPSTNYYEQTGKYYNITVSAQQTGVAHPTYGPIFIIDVATQQANNGYLQYNMFFTESHYTQIYVRYGVSAGYLKTNDDVFIPNSMLCE